MTEPEFQGWLAHSIPSYADEHVRAGNWTTEESLERSRGEHAQLLPKGLQTPNQFLFTIVAGPAGARVGELWYALQRKGSRSDLFVYWIGIDPPHRRHGYARESFEQLEEAAGRLGAQRIVLHVFGDNLGARTLYEGLGFTPTDLVLEKPVHGKAGAPDGGN